MSEAVPEALVFENDPNAEHQRILQAKTKSAMSAWELGSRLARFKENGDWQKVTVGGSYKTFTAYLSKGCGVSRAAAYDYMKAAKLPLSVSLRFGIESAAMLSTLLDLTAAEETVEEAMALEVEADDGTMKPFAAMTVDERQRALARALIESGVVRRGRKPRTDNHAAVELRERIRQAADAHLKPGQVQTRRVGGHDVIDLDRIPIASAKALFKALAAALRH